MSKEVPKITAKLVLSNVLYRGTNLGLILALAACNARTAATPTVSPISTPPESSIPTVVPSLTDTETPGPTETARATESATLTPTETEHFTTPKILLLGDSMFSITKVPTYFSDLLTNAEMPADFVGDKISFGNDVPTDGLGGFDTSLFLIQLTRETVWTELNGTQFPNNLSEHIPDIVIIQLGTNDAINSADTNSDPVPDYENNMQQIINFLRSNNPNVKIVIPMLIPSEDQSYDAKIILIDEAIPDFVKSMDSQNSRVVTTQDLRSDWKIEDFRDDVHPSTSGQKKMAKADFDAVVGNLLISKGK